MLGVTSELRDNTGMGKREAPPNMPPQPDQRQGDPWSAALGLKFERQGMRSVLADNRHSGPLRVQKALYPEGEAICHAVVVHPPGGIAGGDRLAIAVDLGPAAKALITTPGASKWYKARKAGAQDPGHATQTLDFTLAAGASLEWLPQESIVFDAAEIGLRSTIELADGACYAGWEILCLGRAASGETFRHGFIRQQVSVRHAGKLIWNENGTLAAGGRQIGSAVGWQDASVCATLVIAGHALSNPGLEALRNALELARLPDERVALSRLPLVVVARYLGDSSERARALLGALWRQIRPAAIGAPAISPRIWQT
jgi:urease accessory protein